MKDYISILLFSIMLNSFAERIKEPLEYFDMVQLKLESIEVGPTSKVAIIITPDGKRNTVKAGNYMGKNYGYVMEINSEFVKIREIIKIPKKNKWVERDIFLKVKAD